MGIFNPDGIFGRIGGVLADIMVLGLLWIFASIPLVTIGASTTAVYYVTTKKVSRQDGYISKEFWKSFRQNFKKSTIIWIIMSTLFALLGYNIWTIVVSGLFQGYQFILTIQVVILIQALFIMLYVFAVMARFEVGVFQSIRTSLFLANRHILTTILNGGLFLVLIFFSLEFSFLFLFLMGVYCYFSSFGIVKIFKKYRPELDPEIIISQELSPLNLGEGEENVVPRKNVHNIPENQEKMPQIINLDVIKNVSKEIESEENIKENQEKENQG